MRYAAVEVALSGREASGRRRGDPPGLAAAASLLGPPLQVLMRLGRQRWRLKGRIESDDSQTWDSGEKAFVPALRENLEIKVGAGLGRTGGPGARLRHHPPVPTRR